LSGKSPRAGHHRGCAPRSWQCRHYPLLVLVHIIQYVLCLLTAVGGLWATVSLLLRMLHASCDVPTRTRCLRHSEANLASPHSENQILERNSGQLHSVAFGAVSAELKSLPLPHFFHPVTCLSLSPIIGAVPRQTPWYEHSSLYKFLECPIFPGSSSQIIKTSPQF
jgi:hypothetical protein